MLAQSLLKITAPGIGRPLDVAGRRALLEAPGARVSADGAGPLFARFPVALPEPTVA